MDPDLIPSIGCRFLGQTSDVTHIVDDIFGRIPPELSVILGLSTDADLLRIGLGEVLRTVLLQAGPQTLDDDAMVDLWIEPTLVIIGVTYRGPVMPPWLIQNWDRGREPAVFSPSESFGTGWLLVRQAFDSVHDTQCGAHRVLLLEKRL